LGRLIFWLLIAVLFWWFVKGLLKSRKPDEKPSESARVEDMVACTRCGVNMPQSEARLESGKYYCASNPRCLP
jgi:uncharacterized protein